MSVSADLRIGSEILGYRIEELVGRGGMGIVYRAYDPRLKRNVALKLIAPELSGDERFRERFLVETELAASLEHPNVVPIHDAGESRLKVSNPQTGQYAARITLQTAVGPIPLPWGWASVDASVGSHTFRFATTHLDSISGQAQVGQAQEFLAGPGATTLPLVWLAAPPTRHRPATSGDRLGLRFAERAPRGGILSRMLVFLVLLALLAGPPAAESAPAGHAKLELLGRTPLSLHGLGFEPGERVRVVAQAKGSYVRTLLASRRGSFLVRFAGVSVGRCDPLFVRATGSRGSRALIKIVPECNPLGQPQ